MSEIASKKKKRNEFLISSAEKKYRLFNSISVILQHSHLFQAEWVFFSPPFFLIWLAQAKILRDVPNTSSSVQWNKIQEYLLRIFGPHRSTYKHGINVTNIG